jgi:hypothetical protein
LTSLFSSSEKLKNGFKNDVPTLRHPSAQSWQNSAQQ